MKNKLALLPAVVASVLCAALVGCADKVPKVADPHNIIVDGKPMTQKDFLNTYCNELKDHPTCVAVAKAMVQDASKGKSAPPRF